MNVPGGRDDAPSPPARPGLWAAGILSAATFWIPLWTPLFQALTLAAAIRLSWQRRADRPSLLIGLVGGLGGLALFLLLEYVWVV